jgi:protein-tyrosine phosphatase
MRQVPGHLLWLGHVGDARDVRAVLSAGILAVMDLAGNEPPIDYPRDIAYTRFPLVDGAGNPPWLVRSTVACLTEWLTDRIPSFVYCSAGLSRSPAVAAVALSRITGQSPADMLKLVTGTTAHDVSPGLWADMMAVWRG